MLDTLGLIRIASAGEDTRVAYSIEKMRLSSIFDWFLISSSRKHVLEGQGWMRLYGIVNQWLPEQLSGYRKKKGGCHRHKSHTIIAVAAAG